MRLQWWSGREPVQPNLLVSRFMGLTLVTFLAAGTSSMCGPSVCVVHLPCHLRPRAVRDHVRHPHQPHHPTQPDAGRPDRAGAGHVALG